jgi:hypothetical protein
MIAVTVAIERIENRECDPGQIFGGGYRVEHHRLVIRKGTEEFRHGFVAAPDQKGMIPGIDHMPFGDGLDLGKIHHHAVVGLSCGVDHAAAKGDFQRITVAVQVAALALVVRDPVARIEFEATCYAHGRDVWQSGCIGSRGS